jgi:hypothetical protein
VFHLADYFKASGVTLSDPPFLDKVVIHFAIYEEKDHYHVPLLCSPWSYSTTAAVEQVVLRHYARGTKRLPQADFLAKTPQTCSIEWLATKAR